MARNRYISVKDRPQKMPTGPLSLLNQAIFQQNELMKRLLGALFSEPGRPCVEPNAPEESVGVFLKRRFGTPVAHLASAVMHGIYAGDVWKLSAFEILPFLSLFERSRGPIIPGALIKGGMSNEDIALMKILEAERSDAFIEGMRDASIFYFRGGLQTLAQALADKVAQFPNVTIHRGIEVSKVVPPDQDELVTIYTSPSTGEAESSRRYTKVISALSAKQTSPLVGAKLSTLQDIPFVTVMVINFYFDKADLLKRYPGFGYLIPQPAHGNHRESDVLGVIFDSYVTPNIDSSKTAPTGTKVTAMMGGHYWDGRASLPSEDEAISEALRLLREHLGIIQYPSDVLVTLQKDCIAQYNVGHKAKLAHLRKQVIENYGGKLALVGSSYTGVGVNDCIRAGRELEMFYNFDKNCTGLERALSGPSFIF
jgi:oxygen-dependent protoporphyrinogen oxidase